CPSAMGFEYRSADGEPHAHAVRLRRVEWAEQPGQILRVYSCARILYGHEHLIGPALLRTDQQYAVAAGDRRHGLHAIHQEIDDHLLQLDSIAVHQGQSRGKLEPHRHSVTVRFRTHERDCLLEDVADIELGHFRIVRLGVPPNAAEDVACPPAVTDHCIDGRSYFSAHRYIVVVQQQANFAV